MNPFLQQKSPIEKKYNKKNKFTVNQIGQSNQNSQICPKNPSVIEVWPQKQNKIKYKIIHVCQKSEIPETHFPIICSLAQGGIQNPVFPSLFSSFSFPKSSSFAHLSLNFVHCRHPQIEARRPFLNQVLQKLTFPFCSFFLKQIIFQSQKLCVVLAYLHVSIFAIFITVHVISLIRFMCFTLIRSSCLKLCSRNLELYEKYGY